MHFVHDQAQLTKRLLITSGYFVSLLDFSGSIIEESAMIVHASIRIHRLLHRCCGQLTLKHYIPSKRGRRRARILK
jgi:hypothetical protein